MDFSGRGSQQSDSFNAGAPYNSAPAASHGPKKSGKPSESKTTNKWLRWGVGSLGVLILALVVALLLAIGFHKNQTEDSYVDNSKLQAVFLQTGQVYFGNITKLNNDYVVLQHIYYLQTSGNSSDSSTSNANTNVSLVKLGCELHSPYDQMVINRDQVTFWENLHEDGQVAKAVATFQKDNPDGQKCTDQSAAPNSNSNVQGTTNTSTNGTKQ